MNTGSTGTIGIIGNGRAATHLSHYLRLLGADVRAWDRNSAEGRSPEQAFEECGRIWVLISDAQIEPFLREHPSLQSRAVHASGALVTPLAEGFHPLMSFPTGRLHDERTYREMAFVGESAARFRELFPFFPNPVFEVPGEKRALYHALCVLSGNGTALLWQQAFDRFERELGIPREACLPYLRAVSENLIFDGSRALTGPWVRGDRGTIERNLASLEGDALHEVYGALLRVFQASQVNSKMTSKMTSKG
jgi:hypothetical protein